VRGEDWVFGEAVAVYGVVRWSLAACVLRDQPTFQMVFVFASLVELFSAVLVPGLVYRLHDRSTA